MPVTTDAKPRRFDELESMREVLARGGDLRGCALQGLDLSDAGIDWSRTQVQGCLFLGCRLGDHATEAELVRRGAMLFPRFEGLPYDPYRGALYTWRELMQGYDPVDDRSLDRRIYDHMQQRKGDRLDLLEALAQRIHDHAIDDAMRELLRPAGEPRRAVGIMGGHSTPRTSEDFRRAARLAWRLTQAGYLVITGGGPGVMEAGNLGAYLAGQEYAAVEQALQLLSPAPRYTVPGYLEAAMQVLARFPAGETSLAVPTWFYGHEPSNLFASHIAKYFSNSLREDGLLAVALHGIVFAPGSAGTTQEIFQDAAQNHYGSFGFHSPMVFLGRERYEADTGLFPLLQRLAEGRRYAELLAITDDPDEAADFIEAHPPVPAKRS